MLLEQYYNSLLLLLLLLLELLHLFTAAVTSLFNLTHLREDSQLPINHVMFITYNLNVCFCAANTAL